MAANYLNGAKGYSRLYDYRHIYHRSLATLKADIKMIC